MAESDSSSSGNSFQNFLMKYRKKVREDGLSNRLSLESSQNSNINININLPTTSGSTSFYMSLESGSKNEKNKTNAKKPLAGNKTRKKMKVNKPKSNTPKSSKNEGNERDPDYAPNYVKLTSKELNSIASRVRIYHETGIVVSDEEDVLPCRNKYKRKPKNKNLLKQRGPQVCGTKFGQGSVGVPFSRFGVSKCACCNVNKDNCSSLNLRERQNQVCFSEILEGMSEHMRNQLQQREERFLQVQQRDLLKHPELSGSNDTTGTESVVPADLPQDKREWIQRFIDSMSADRVDYAKPEQLNIVEGISHKRPSDVHFQVEDLTNSLDAKTIVQRIDFEKEKERLSKLKQSRVDEWLKTKTTAKFHTNEMNAMSTPRPLILDQPISVEAMPSTSTIRNDALEDCSFRTSIFPEEPHVFTSTRIGSTLDDCSSDITHLDRSNITIRTPQSKRVKEAGHISIPSSSKPKVPINLNEESDIMNFVESLVAAEEESINQEVHERCERIYRTVESTRNVLQDALDEVLITSDNSTDAYDHILDNSVEVIDPVPEMLNNIYTVGDDSVQVIESDDEVIPTVSLVDSLDIPSTSRLTRATRLKRTLQNSPHGSPKKRNKNQNATKLPSISETAPSASCAKPDSLVTTENKSSARSLQDCAICLESLATKDISSTICGHVFCTPCITAAVRAQRACPNCRTRLSLKKIHPLFI